jgi:hypothetical protein
VGSAVEVTKEVVESATARVGEVGEKGGAGEAGMRRMIAMIHAGSDIFARQCYAPGMRAHHPVTACASLSQPPLVGCVRFSLSLSL